MTTPTTEQNLGQMPVGAMQTPMAPPVPTAPMAPPVPTAPMAPLVPTAPMTSSASLNVYRPNQQTQQTQSLIDQSVPSIVSTPQKSSVPETAPSSVPTSMNVNSTTDVSSNNPQDAIIAQQQAKIEALMGQNAALNAQVVQMIQGGAQITEAPAAQPQATQIAPQVQQMLQMGIEPDPLGQLNTPSLTNSQDYSLESLASEIGKPNE